MKFIRTAHKSNFAVDKLPSVIVYTTDLEANKTPFKIIIDRTGVRLSGESPCMISPAQLNVFAEALSDAYFDFDKHYKVKLKAHLAVPQ